MSTIDQKIRHITWLGLVINLALAGFKFMAGFIGQSQAMIADAIHSISDLVTDIAVLVGSCYWNNPPDTEHPYGHHRIETIVTIFIGIILLVTAIGIANTAISSLSSKGELDTTLPLTITLAAIILKEILYQLTKKKAITLKSSALFANAKHHRSDVLSSLPVLAAMIITTFFPTLTYIDKIGAIIVALFIAKASWDICFPAIAEIIETSAPARIRTRIENLVLSIEEVKSTHAIRTRKCGAYYHLDLHVQVDPSLTVREAHIISGKVKAILLKDHCGIKDVIVHIEPFSQY